MVKISKKKLFIFLAEISLIATLFPILAYVPKTIGYVIAVGVILLTSFIFLAFSRSFNLLKISIENSPHFWIFFLFLLLSQYVVTLLGFLDIWGLIKVVGYLMVAICGYFIFPALFLKDNCIYFPWSFFSKLGAIFSFFGILIVLKGKIEFLGLEWSASLWNIPLVKLPATSSLFSDPNYFSIIPFLGFIGSLYLIKSQKFSFLKKLGLLFLSGLNLAGIFFSYSRAAYLATFFLIVFLILMESNFVKKLILTTLIILSIFILFNTIQNIPQLQTFLGTERALFLSGREILWPAAIEVLNTHPILGWGIGNVDEIILSQNLPNSWTSSHNSFLDFAIMCGIPVTLLYLLVIIISIKRLYYLKSQRFDRKILLCSIFCMLIIMQFTTHTLGGVAFGSFVFSFLLGTANFAFLKSNNFLEHG
jgi:O-antigen ligase